MAERFSTRSWSLSDTAAILGETKEGTFRTAVERIARRWPGRTRFIVDHVEVTKRGRWWFRFGRQWTDDDYRPLRWVVIKSATTTGGLCPKAAAVAGDTDLPVAGGRVARFGKRWLTASGALYETARGTSERIEAAE